jgi:hypothetical protein
MCHGSTEESGLFCTISLTAAYEKTGTLSYNSRPEVGPCADVGAAVAAFCLLRPRLLREVRP